MERGKSELNIQYYPLYCEGMHRLRAVFYRFTDIQGKVSTRKEIEISRKKGK